MIGITNLQMMGEARLGKPALSRHLSIQANSPVPGGCRRTCLRSENHRVHRTDFVVGTAENYGTSCHYRKTPLLLIAECPGAPDPMQLGQP